MNIKNILSVLSAVFILVSCERSVEFDTGITNPYVVVNSFVSPDSQIVAHVSVSRFFLKDSIDFRNENNAEVNLWVNGILKEKLTNDTLGIYTGNYKPTLSDNLKLTVNVPQMKEVSATTDFVEAPVILAADTQVVYGSKRLLTCGPNCYDTVGIRYSYKVNFKLKFTDNANQKNYYRLLVRKITYTGNWNDDTYNIDTVANNDLPSYGAFDFTDVISGNTKNPLTADDTNALSGLMLDQNNDYHVFSDDLINGKTYTLEFNTNHETDRFFLIDNLRYAYGNTLRNEIYVSLQSISKEYYQYLLTRAASKTINYFSEPIQVYTNIKGGVGILGSYTTSNIVKIDLP